MDGFDETVTADSSRRRIVLGSVLMGAVCAAALLATSPGLPMVWDEGNAVLRAEGISRWATRWLPGGPRPGPFSRRAIVDDWPYTVRFDERPSSVGLSIRAEGHPALYGIVIALGQAVSSWWLKSLDAARFGPMMLFGLAAGAMGYRMWRDYSATAAVGAVAALVLMPRMFAHGHFASYDGTLTSCWVLAWATFAPAQNGWRGKVVWGIVLGMTLSCKATGWIAPIPFAVWALVCWDREAAKALAVGLPLAVLTFFVLNPPLWHQPIHGPVEFFDLNLNRVAHGWNIPILFLGETHHLGNPLPWYNTLFWTAVTVPLGTLLLALIGLAAVLRRCRADRAGLLLLANWLVLLLVRALPGAPPHDGIRLFLPSFAFLAALAGVGCGAICARAAKRWAGRNRAKWLAAGAVGMLYAGSATSLFWYAPQWLSYYNLAIGGLPGATAAGMEPTYYWDGLDRSVLKWLHENTESDQRICFGAGSAENLALMRHWEILRRAADGHPAGEFRWYVIQHRPGTWDSPGREADRPLFEQATPAFRKTIRDGGAGPWRLDVPLVAVYSRRQYQRARGGDEQ